jgi:hypothetical protein
MKELIVKEVNEFRAAVRLAGKVGGGRRQDS